MKVLFYLYFPAGGIGRYTARLMPELTAAGATVEAAVVPEFAWRDAGGFRVWPELRSISHASVLRRKLRFLTGQFINPRRLAARARVWQPDVIHICNVNHLSYPTWERCFPADGPRLAVSVHDVQRQRGILCKPWEAWQLRRFYRRADLLLVHSQSQADELEEWAGVLRDKICVVPHGPYDYAQPTESREAVRRRLGVPDQASLGLAFGQVRDEKRIDRLIRAIQQQPDSIHLLIAGRCPPGHQPMTGYQQLARELGVESRVHFENRFIPDEEVANLFQASDWSALTYAVSFTSQSGVLNSAVNYRIPVLATPAPSFRESLQQFSIGVLCEDDSVDAISDGISQLQNRPATTWEFDAYLAANSWAENASVTMAEYTRITEGAAS